ncbi:hypothetical protein [Kribbella sp. NPDC048915]|uniref:hypothetical protein n=1 Tax=Kribbella sp. NPDC048915 TaxID=3155148 RepID=UPI0033FCFD27
MIRELSGADQALRSFLDHLSQQGMIPALDEHGLPLPEDLAGKDPAVVLSRTENWQRACEQIARHRLEAGYDHAAQDRLTFQLTQHRTGGPPRVRSYRITLEQHFDRATPIGLANYDAVVNVDFGVSSSGRTTTQARSLPWSARLGLSDAPAAGQAGTAPTLGTAIGRSSRGRSLGSSSSRGAYRMAVAESASRAAVFDIPHTIRITELTADGAVPVASSEGSAQVWLDGDFCRDATESTVAVRGPVEPGLLQTATIHQIDVRDPIDQLTAAAPALGHHNSAALHHLNAFLAPRNLMTHPELLTTEYRTSLAVGPVPAGPLTELRQRALTPQPGTLALTTRIENLRYVGSGPVTLSELNVTFATTGTTASRSAATTAGFSAGYGLVSADGPSYDVSHGSARTTSASSSTTVSKTSGVERTLIRDGQHYQFWGDLVLEARLRLGTAHDVPLDNGAVVLTLPESEALLSYGRGALDLPLHQVSDAVERLLNGNLELPRRTMTALLLRYQIDKQGATDSLAARHTDEVIVAALQKTFGFAKKSAPALDAVLRSAEDLAQLRVRTQLPRHYDRTMGAAQIDTAAFRDSDGNGTDLFREIRAAVADHSRRALNDPVLIDALRGNFAEPRWRNQMDNMLDPGGFVDELPVRGGAGSRKLKLRVRLRFTGGPTTDLGGTQDVTGNGFGLVQLWTFRERGRSVSRSTSYGTSLNGTATDGIPVGSGIGAELSTSTTASSSEINTRITAGLALKTARIERDCRVEIEVEDSAEPGVTTRRVVTGRLTLAVPASVLDSAPPQLGPEDHRTVVLPDRYLPEATLPYLTGTAEDNTLFAAACARLRRRDLLTPDGVRMHATTLESQFGAANRLTEFQEIAGESGHELVPLPVPGKPTKVVVVRVRAEISGLELVSDPDPDSAIQLGENTRAINVSQLTARSNRLLPGSRTVSSGTPGGELSTSLSSSGRVSQQDTGTVGARHETGVYESSQFVTVKVRVDYHLDFERLRLGRRLRPKVERSDTVRRAAVGEGYVTMYRHEYARMQEQMESGRTAGPRPADGPTVQETVDADERHPYQPLINALERARREDVNVRLVIRKPNGRRSTVVARPDGTMTGRNDGGFAAAFATLHPRLALLAEGRVDLRALHSAQTSQRFTSVVVDALQQQGIPAAALTAMDARTSGPRSSDTPAYRSRNSHQATGTAIE